MELLSITQLAQLRVDLKQIAAHSPRVVRLEQRHRCRVRRDRRSTRRGAALTIANIVFQANSLARPREQGNVRLNDQVTDAPFGAYAEPDLASAPRG
jgi:hypothetical protein